MVVENSYYEDIQRIWKENNHRYIAYESNIEAINNPNMKQFVWREDNISMAYVIVYEGKDFCEKDKFPNKIANMPEKVAYVWEIVTDKKYAGKGIGSKLLDYIIMKYQDYTLYSCIDITNVPSLKLHEKKGFSVLYQFEKAEKNKTNSHVMMERIPTNGCQKKFKKE